MAGTASQLTSHPLLSSFMGSVQTAKGTNNHAKTDCPVLYHSRWDRETKTAKMGHFILVCAWLGKVCCSPWTRARGACFTTLAPPDSLFLLVGTVTVVRKICLYS